MGTLGTRLKSLREGKELTQVELASMIHVNRATLANWEIDRATPDADTLQQLADVFGVSVDYLLGRTDIREPGPRRGISPSDLDKLLEELPPEERENARNAIFRAGKELGLEGWRSVINFIKWQLSQEDEKGRD